MDKWRYHNGVLCLAELARSGVLGQIVGMHTTRIGYADNHHDVDAAWILAPHDLSIALEVLGGLGSLLAAQGHVDGRGKVRSLAATIGGDSIPWHTMQLSDRSPIERREVHVVGTEGTAFLAGGYATEVEIRRGSVLERRSFEINMPLADELAVFVRHLRGGPAPRSSATEGAAIVRLIASARSVIGADG
jgi:predicted dehydrogenase